LSRTAKDIDRSHVIDTRSVAPSKKLIVTNDLVVHETTRNHITEQQRELPGKVRHLRCECGRSAVRAYGMAPNDVKVSAKSSED
jgi:hypothetical protein